MTRRDLPSSKRLGGFTLVELLVVIAVIAILVGLLAPTLAGARSAARLVACQSNVRQLGLAWTMYASDHHDRAMPMAYTSESDTRGGPPIYWWGDEGAANTPVNHEIGFLSPYLAASLGQRSVYECPEQPWGSYAPQGPSREPTTTYGYNGYYLSPSRTPGWSGSIGQRPWRRLFEIPGPASLFVFADSLLPGSSMPRSTGLLDPPKLYQGPGDWAINSAPTTSFRHLAPRGKPGVNASARADGSGQTTKGEPPLMARSAPAIGSVSADPGPAYIPDWRQW